MVTTSENTDFYILTVHLKVETVVSTHKLPKGNVHASQPDVNRT